MHPHTHAQAADSTRMHLHARPPDAPVGVKETLGCRSNAGTCSTHALPPSPPGKCARSKSNVRRQSSVISPSGLLAKSNATARIAFKASFCSPLGVPFGEIANCADAILSSMRSSEETCWHFDSGAAAGRDCCTTRALTRCVSVDAEKSFRSHAALTTQLIVTQYASKKFCGKVPFSRRRCISSETHEIAEAATCTAL